MTKSFTPKLKGSITCSVTKNIGEKMSFNVSTTDMKLVYEDWDNENENENDCPDEYIFQHSVNIKPYNEDEILDKDYNLTNTNSLEFTITGYAKDEYNYMSYYEIAMTCSFNNDGIKITNTEIKPITE